VIPGIILASGASTRMGSPKALLTMPNGSTFVWTLVTTLIDGGVDDVFVVGRTEDRPLRDEVERLPRSRFVENARADEGQLSSVIAGLNAADRPGVGGVLVTLVDLPLLAPATVRILIDAFTAAHVPIARTSHRGRHGHPVIFGRQVFDELRRANPAVGAKSVVRAHESSLLDVEVDDEGVLRDIDTPEDYRRLTQH
jgi:molybdenum cofactor cytidylyltransferase